MRIDRCICYQKTFKELKQIADSDGINELKELQKKVVFGQKCQLCHPYVKEMLVTGVCVFHEILK